MSDAAPRPTRRQLIGAGAAAGVASLIAAAPVRAVGPAVPETPQLRLTKLLSVELLILYCYDHVLGTPLLSARAQAVLGQLRDHERVHIQTLTAMLARYGLTPPAPPPDVKVANHDLGHRGVQARLGQLQSRDDALGLLMATERVVTGAYFVALLKTDDPALIDVAIRIMGSEAQHEALLGQLLFHGDIQRAVPFGLIQGIQ